MTADQIKRSIWRNSLSNYLRMGLRMVLGFLLFRVLYPPGLTEEEFGFYNTLWNLFVFGILMDFGFGLAAQKKVAELSVHKDWEQLSRVLSTIFFFYFFSGAVIIVGALLSSHLLIGAVRLEGPSRFSTGEIKDLPALAQKIRSAGDPVSKFLRDHLDGDTRARLERGWKSPASLAALEPEFIRSLNGLVTSKEVYDLGLFANVPVREETRKRMESNPKGLALARVNRMLLEDAFPGELSRERANEAEIRENFRQVLVIFLCFLGLSFPTGISIEILYGQQRIALVNTLASLGSIVNFGLVIVAVHLHWGLKGIFLIGLMTSLLPSMIGGYLGLRSLPEVKLRPRLFSWSVLRETTRFSFYAYIGIVTQLIMAQTDRVILATCISLGAVTIYQVGSKVFEIFNAFTLQLPETISPAAAHFHAQGDRQALQKLLVAGTRFNIMLATPIFIMCAFFMEGLMGLLTKNPYPDGQTFWTGEVLMLWAYSTIITHSISKKVFMMCGHEKKLVILSTIEAVANLGLSLGLVIYFRQVVCVAIGSLVPTLIIGWFYLWPWAAKDAGFTGWELARRVLHRSWRGGVPVIIFALVCRFVPALSFQRSLVLFVIEGLIGCLLSAYGIWRWGLSGDERVQVAAKLMNKFGGILRKKPA